jgi:hypothetical protein
LRVRTHVERRVRARAVPAVFGGSAEIRLHRRNVFESATPLQLAAGGEASIDLLRLHSLDLVSIIDLQAGGEAPVDLHSTQSVEIIGICSVAASGSAICEAIADELTEEELLVLLEAA